MALDVPDDLNLMEKAEGAQDPFFGRMASHQLPSPDKLVVVRSKTHSTNVYAILQSQFALVVTKHTE